MQMKMNNYDAVKCVYQGVVGANFTKFGRNDIASWT